MNTLHLTLKKKHFDAILRGEKCEEYREDKPYWRSRLTATPPWTNKPAFKKIDRIIFTNGYRPESPRMLVDCLGLDRQQLVVEGLSGGRTNWYFVLKLGSVLEYTSEGYTVFPQLKWKPRLEVGI